MILQVVRPAAEWPALPVAPVPGEEVERPARAGRLGAVRHGPALHRHLVLHHTALLIAHHRAVLPGVPSGRSHCNLI